MGAFSGRQACGTVKPRCQKVPVVRGDTSNRFEHWRSRRSIPDQAAEAASYVVPDMESMAEEAEDVKSAPESSKVAAALDADSPTLATDDISRVTCESGPSWPDQMAANAKMVTNEPSLLAVLNTLEKESAAMSLGMALPVAFREFER